MKLHQVTILGSTGSIGVSTLDVISRHPDKYAVFALTANQNIDLLVAQCRQYQPKYVVIADVNRYAELKNKLETYQYQGEILAGIEGLETVASHSEVDSVMAAIVGAVGLQPTLAAARAGKRILLANKEALVMAGSLFMQAVKNNHAMLLPVDSEHNALFQCFPTDAQQRAGVHKLILTASGGAFRSRPLEELSLVTPEQACTHPNWIMGRKVTVDSATMMNKALEVIEAHYLFDMPADKITVLLHPQSIIHSMVEYLDGSILSQMGNPDMRTPIAHALAYPERIVSGVSYLELANKELTFYQMDLKRYPCLEFAYQALLAGGTAATIINAANEEAVAAFLQNRIKFTDIYSVVAEVMSKVEINSANNLDIIFEADKTARRIAAHKIGNINPVVVGA